MLYSIFHYPCVILKVGRLSLQLIKGLLTHSMNICKKSLMQPYFFSSPENFWSGLIWFDLNLFFLIWSDLNLFFFIRFDVNLFFLILSDLIWTFFFLSDLMWTYFFLSYLIWSDLQDLIFYKIRYDYYIITL